MPQPESRHPGLYQSSRATPLELWASPDLLRPPQTQLDSSWSHGKLEITSQIYPTFSSIGCYTQFRRKSDPPARTRNLKTLLPKRKAGNSWLLLAAAGCSLLRLTRDHYQAPTEMSQQRVNPENSPQDGSSQLQDFILPPRIDEISINVFRDFFHILRKSPQNLPNFFPAIL